MCDHYTNEELVMRSRNGDSNALALLTSRFAGRARARYPAGYLDKDDLEQEGMLGFLSAVSSFDPDAGASFETYAAVCIHNRIVSAARRATRSDPLHTQPMPPDSPNPLDQIISGESADAIINVMDSGLSANEREAIAMYISGYGVKDISVKLGITEKSAENALQRAKRKLKQYYGSR